MPNYGLNEVHLRHDELLRRGEQAQRSYEQRLEQQVNGQERRLAWPESIGVFLKRFTSRIHVKDTHWNAKSPSTTAKPSPSAQES